MLTYRFIFESLWKLKFIILSVLLAIFCLFQYSTIKNNKIDYLNSLDKIASDNILQKNLLLEKVRDQEIKINEQLTKNSILKRDKDEQINDLNSSINDSSNRLQQLTKQAIEADKRQCTNTTTTNVIEKVVKVPAAKGSGELTREMAEDFQQLSIECSSNYERLKNEAIELEGWSSTITDNFDLTK